MNKQSLMQKMKQGTIAHGWDVITAFNREKCNRLLALQYLTNLADEKVNTIKNGEIKNESTYYVITGLVLGQPRLSFDFPDIENAKARMLLPFISGRIDVEYYSEQDNTRYLKQIIEINEAHQYVLTVAIDLKSGVSGTDDQNKILIDLTENNLKFTTNIAEDEIANDAIGKHFRDLFKSGDLPVNKFELGELKEINGSPLNPKEFRLLTMSAGSEETGKDKDGAVLAFIRTSNTKPGSLPTTDSGFPYLIPDDKDADGIALYDAALVVSVNTLCRDFIQPQLVKLPSASAAVIKENNFSVAQVTTTLTGPEAFTRWDKMIGLYYCEYYANTVTAGNRNTVLKLENISYAPRDNKLNVSYRDSTSVQVEIQPYIDDEPTTLRSGPIILSAELNFRYGLVADADTLKLHFARETSPDINFEITDASVVKELHAGTDEARELASCVAQTIREPLQALAISIKDFELFPTANLLFPEQNGFRLVSADLPGDILALGRLNPRTTTMEITPLAGVAAPGNTLQFSLNAAFAQAAADTTWEVLNIDGKTKGRGTVTSGLYCAPDKTLIDEASLQELIVARYDGKTAKAMVTVVTNSVTVNPTFYFTAAGALDGEGHQVTLELNAVAVTGNSMDWNFADHTAGGTLENKGSTAVYTPPARVVSGAYAMDVITARNADTGHAAPCAVLNFTKPTGTFVGMSELLPKGDILLRPSRTVTISVNPNLDDRTLLRCKQDHSSEAIIRAAWSHMQIGTQQANQPVAFDAFRKQIIAEAQPVFIILHGGGSLKDTSYEIPGAGEDGEPVLVHQVEYTAPDVMTSPCAVIVYYFEVKLPVGKFISYSYKIVRFPPSERSVI